MKTLFSAVLFSACCWCRLWLARVPRLLRTTTSAEWIPDDVFSRSTTAH